MGFIIFALWVMVVIYVLNAILVPLTVGRPRKPMTSEGATSTIIFNLVFAVILALAAVQLTNGA